MNMITIFLQTIENKTQLTASPCSTTSGSRTRSLVLTFGIVIQFKIGTTSTKLIHSSISYTLCYPYSIHEHAIRIRQEKGTSFVTFKV